MSKKRYQLNNSGTMVSAISNVNAPAVGTVWEPQTQEEIAEAEALANVGYAEVTTREATELTRSQAENGAPKPKVSGIKETPVLQEDGTYKNKAGVQVHADGSEFFDGDQDVLDFLSGNVNDVVAGLGEWETDSLGRIAYLEGIGKNRKGVIDGITAAQAAAGEAK